MMSSGKPLLPSLAVLLNNDKRDLEPCSPLLDSMKSRFCNDDHGVIRLPPLGFSGIGRPRSVDSALRHSASAPIIGTTSGTPAGGPRMRTQSFTEGEPSAPTTPSTPVVRKKSTNQSSKKNDMLTPLSAARAVITPSANDKKRAFAFITHSQETFPTKEPKIDNAPLARRKRRRTSTQELNILQAEFNVCPAPDKRKRQELAERCNMSEKAVQIWFQNKRQACKRQHSATQKAACVAQLEVEPEAQASETPESAKTRLTVATPELASGETTPPRTGKRGQALTFHLTSDKKVLTPVKTSPNSRVNKLINGDGAGSPCSKKPRSAANTASLISSASSSPTRRAPLKELDRNTLVH